MTFQHVGGENAIGSLLVSLCSMQCDASNRNALSSWHQWCQKENGAPFLKYRILIVKKRVFQFDLPPRRQNDAVGNGG